MFVCVCVFGGGGGGAGCTQTERAKILGRSEERRWRVGLLSLFVVSVGGGGEWGGGRGGHKQKRRTLNFMLYR